MMARFNPTIRQILPDNEPDLLAGAVHDSLTRKLYYKLSWGLGTTLVMTILTCGVGPIIAMIGWLRGVIAQHEQQCWHLAEWIRLQTGDPDAAELQRLSYEMRFSPALAAGSAIGLLAAVAGVLLHFEFIPFDIFEVYAFAFEPPRELPGLLFVLGLSTAAGCNWIHLARHQQRVERYVRYFNALISPSPGTLGEGWGEGFGDRAARRPSPTPLPEYRARVTEHRIDPIPLPRLTLGLRPLWIFGGLVLTWAGALWGLPVMLAGAAHRRYTIGTSVLVRSMLAERMRAMLSSRRPPVRVPAPVMAARHCVRPNCRAPLPSAATFCPRCGTRAARLMDVVA